MKAIEIVSFLFIIILNSFIMTPARLNNNFFFLHFVCLLCSYSLDICRIERGTVKMKLAYNDFSGRCSKTNKFLLFPSPLNDLFSAVFLCSIAESVGYIICQQPLVLNDC